MKICVALMALLLCGTALPAAPAADEQKFREMMGLEDFAVSYRDDSGAELAFDKFQESVKGKSYTMMKDPDKGTAVIQIKDKPTRSTPDKFLVKRGERLPEASLRDLDARSIELHSRAGRPLLINFFFAACAPCIKETPALNTFAQQRQDIDVVAVTFDDPAAARKYATKHGFVWPIVPDGQGLLDQLGIKSFPSFAYLGKDGRVLGFSAGSGIREKGEITAEALQAWIGKLEAK